VDLRTTAPSHPTRVLALPRVLFGYCSLTPTSSRVRALAGGRVLHRSAGHPADRGDDRHRGGGGAGAERDGARAAGGYPRRAERGGALPALLADQPYRGAAWAGPLPARATAPGG